MSKAIQQQSDPNAKKKKWFLLIENPTKSNHLGTLLRCAAAFQVHQVLLVGYDKFNCQGSFGSHLFLDIVAFHSWDAALDYLRSGICLDNDSQTDSLGMSNIDEESKCIKTLPIEQQIEIVGIMGACCGEEELFSQVGVKIYKNSTGNVSLKLPGNDQDGSCPLSTTSFQQNENDNRIVRTDKQMIDEMGIKGGSESNYLQKMSYPVHTRPFSTHTCFLLSKTRSGLSTSQAQFCDGFVHVPHLNIFKGTSIEKKSVTSDHSTQQTIQPSTQLLDTATIFSIVLHHFTAWAEYSERQFEENQKFVKDSRPTRVRYLGVGKTYTQGTDVEENEDNAYDEHTANMALWKSEHICDY